MIHFLGPEHSLDLASASKARFFGAFWRSNRILLRLTVLFGAFGVGVWSKGFIARREFRGLGSRASRCILVFVGPCVLQTFVFRLFFPVQGRLCSKFRSEFGEFRKSRL